MTKKLIGIALVASMALSLAACGGDTTSSTAEVQTDAQTQAAT